MPADNREALVKLLESTKKPEDPEILKLVLLLANKAMDMNGFRRDGEGALIVRDVNF